MDIKECINLTREYERLEVMSKQIEEASSKNHWIAIKTPRNEDICLEEGCVEEILKWNKNRMKKIKEELGCLMAWEYDD